MSERVAPEKLGVFYVKWGDDTKTIARISIKGDCDAVARFFNGADVSVKNRNLSILAPVPSAEAVAAVQSKWIDLCRKLEAAGWHPSDVEDLNNAIAGLTGGEVP